MRKLYIILSLLCGLGLSSMTSTEAEAQCVHLGEDVNCPVGVPSGSGSLFFIPGGIEWPDGVQSFGECCPLPSGTDTGSGFFPIGNAHPNQLWGDWFISDSANSFAQGDGLVHIEADPNADPSATGYTFYGRYAAPGGGAYTDSREPLGTTWGTRYLQGGNFDCSTTNSCGNDTIIPTPITLNACAGGDCNWRPGAAKAGPRFTTPIAARYPVKITMFPFPKLSIDGSTVVGSLGKRTIRIKLPSGQFVTEEITIMQTEDGKIYGVGAGLHNFGPMHESRNQPFPDQTQYSFDEDPIPRPPTPPGDQSVSASDIDNITDGGSSPVTPPITR